MLHGKFTVFGKSLVIQLDVLGEQHPDVALSYNNTNLYQAQKRYAEALEYCKKALQSNIADWKPKTVSDLPLSNTFLY